MTHTGIECFLAICRHKTGSAAAQALYITQPSLSARLKVLERELGLQLFYRRKGSREMVLTPAGQEFYGLAVEYEALLEKMRALGETQKSVLRVSCFNSLGTYLLPTAYSLFLQTNPQTSLQVQDMEIAAASQSILQAETDLALTSGHVSDRQLRQFPAFSEPMVLVCPAASRLQGPVHPADLPPQEEVFVEWSHDFVRWHREKFGSGQPRLCVSIMAQLRQLLMQEQRWAIVPISVAEGLAAECEIRRLETDFPLPRREVSCVVGAQRPVPALDAFLDCLRQALTAYPDIKVHL